MAKRPLFGPPLLRPFKKGETRPNADGSYSTEISMTAPDPSGQWMNFPSLWMGPNGPVQFKNEDDALNAALNFERFGSSFPRFATLQQAEKVAEDRSKAGGVGTGELAKPNDKAGPNMPAPYGLLFPGFMGQRFALPMEDDLSRLPPDRGLIEGDMPGRGPLPGPYELAAMRRPAPMARPQSRARQQSQGRPPGFMSANDPRQPQLVGTGQFATGQDANGAPARGEIMQPAGPMPAAGPLGGLFAPENRDTLAALGIGLMRGDFASGMSDALKIKQVRTAENQTRAWLMKRGLSEEDAALAASNPAMMQYLLKPGAVDEYKQRADLATQYNLDPNSPEGRSFILTGKLPEGKDGPSSIREYEYAVQHDGYKGSFTDWQTKSVREQDPTFGREKDLRAEFEGSPIVKNYQVVRDNYERIRQGAALTTGAGDIAVIFGYMKMLDPTSVVRENEQATAANAGGVPAQIRNLYNRVATGEMLPPESKAEILQAADQVYSEQAKNLEDYAKRYSGIATQYQLDPNRVVQQPEKYAPLSLGVGQSKDAGSGVTIKRLE